MSSDTGLLFFSPVQGGLFGVEARLRRGAPVRLHVADPPLAARLSAYAMTPSFSVVGCSGPAAPPMDDRPLGAGSDDRVSVQFPQQPADATSPQRVIILSAERRECHPHGTLVLRLD